MLQKLVFIFENAFRDLGVRIDELISSPEFLKNAIVSKVNHPERAV